MVDYRLKVEYKKNKKTTFFLKKSAFFRHFSVSFVIFNIKVKELEDRKISPVSSPFYLKIIKCIIDGTILR